MNLISLGFCVLGKQWRIKHKDKFLMSEAMGIVLFHGKAAIRAVPIFVPLSVWKEAHTLKAGKKNIKRGDIFYADLDPVVGSEQSGVRPVLILSNNLGNRNGPTVIVCAITSKTEKNNIPTHVHIDVAGRLQASFALLEQIRTVDCLRLREKVGELSGYEMSKIDQALSISVGLDPAFL